MILCDYLCGGCTATFEAMVGSPAPDDVICPECGSMAAWSPSPVLGRVKSIEVSRGGYAKPDRKTWLDTRELGEGMPLAEFKAKRRKIREEQTWRETKELLK